LFAVPSAGKINCKIGVIIASHSFCVRLRARSGYISVLQIVDCHAVQISVLDNLPACLFSTQSLPCCIIFSTCCFLLPSGAMRIPNVSSATSVSTHRKISVEPSIYFSLLGHLDILQSSYISNNLHAIQNPLGTKKFSLPQVRHWLPRGYLPN
jgi:hypothetical protein